MTPQIAAQKPNDSSNIKISASPWLTRSDRTDCQARSDPMFLSISSSLTGRTPWSRRQRRSCAGERGGVGRPSNRNNHGKKLGAVSVRNGAAVDNGGIAVRWN